MERYIMAGDGVADVLGAIGNREHPRGVSQ